MVRSNGPMWASAPTGRRGSLCNHPGQRHRANRPRRGRKGRVEFGTESIPKMSSNLGQSLSQPAADSSLYTREPFPAGDGGCGLPRRPCGPPRNDSRFLSFRGAERRGNPSFLRWTGVRAAPRTTRGTARRVVVPYGKPNQSPGPAAHSGASAPAGARDGRESAQGPSQKEDRRRDRPGSA